MHYDPLPRHEFIFRGRLAARGARAWQAFSRKHVIHAETGLAFDEVASERGAVPTAA